MERGEIIESLLAWNFWQKDIETGIKRQLYLEQISRYLKTDEVVALAGVRRCGKSTILLQVLAGLIDKGLPKQNTLYINFEDPKFYNFLGLDLLDKIWQAYQEYLRPQGKVYLVLDEVQKIRGWEHWVRAKYDQKERVKIFVTDSNAELLSAEFSSVLTGRHLEVAAAPLNFREYLGFKGVKIEKDKLWIIENQRFLYRHALEYLRIGGFPKIVLTEDELLRQELLTQYFNDILTKDIRDRYKLKEAGKLKNLALFFATNFTRPYTFRKVKVLSEIPLSLDTVHRFSHYLENSFIVDFLSRFSYSLKNRMQTARKVYFVDNGLRGAIAFKFSSDTGKLLENAVFHHLKQQKKEVYYYQEKQEVDFVVKEGLKITGLINVSSSIEDRETYLREISSLKEAMRYFKQKEAVLITLEGKEYWEKLYKRAGELFGTENITIPTLTRPWIVPNEIIIRESADDAYIYKATLRVMLEEDYIRSQVTSYKSQVNLQDYTFKDSRLKELNEYSTQLIRETIIPKLTFEVNTSKRYAPLRQVYYSLILAQWFKARYRSPQSTVISPQNNPYIKLIDSRDLTNLTCKEPFDKQTYFRQYQKSFHDGEYNLSEPTYTPFGQGIRRYMSGGGKFNMNIPPLGESSRGTVGSPIIISIPAKSSPNHFSEQGITYTNKTQMLIEEKAASSSLDENTLKEIEENLQNYFKPDFFRTLKSVLDVLDGEKTMGGERTKKLIIAIRDNNPDILIQRGPSQEKSDLFLERLGAFIKVFSQEKARKLIQDAKQEAVYLPILDELHRLLFPAKAQLRQVIKILRDENKEFHRVIDFRKWPEDTEFIFVGDLHGRIDNLKKILGYDNNLKKLQENKAVLVILGDAVHSEENLREMNTSLEIMREIRDLKIKYPHNFFYVLGNHDPIDEYRGDPKYGVQQWRLYKERMEELYGKDYIDLYKEFLKHSPLMVMGNGFVGMHAGPIVGPLKEGWWREKTFIEKLRKMSQNPKIIEQALRGTYQENYGLPKVEQFLQNLGQSNEAVFITGHKPQDKSNWHWQISDYFHIIVAMRERVGYASIKNNKLKFIEVGSKKGPSLESDDVTPPKIEESLKDIDTIFNKGMGSPQKGWKLQGHEPYPKLREGRESNGIDLTTLPEGTLVFMEKSVEQPLPEGRPISGYSHLIRIVVYLLRIEKGGMVRLWYNNEDGSYIGPLSLLTASGKVSSEEEITFPNFKKDEEGNLLPLDKLPPEEKIIKESFPSFKVMIPKKKETKNLGGERKGGFGKFDFEKEISILAGSFAFKIWVKEGKTYFQPFSRNNRDLSYGEAIELNLGAPYQIGYYFMQLSYGKIDAGLSQRHFSFSIKHNLLGLYTLSITDTNSRTGTVVEYEPTSSSSPLSFQPLTPQTFGGIDFTRLPIVTQAITNLGSSPLRPSSYPSLRQLNLSEEYQAMERLASSGISPHPERLKSFLQASCLQDKIGEDKDNALGLLSDVLRNEESSLRPTAPELRDILVVLESSASNQQLKEIFLGK